jgi:hypothetical protein
VDKKPPRKRKRQAVTDRTDVHAVLKKVHELKLKSNNPNAYSLRYLRDRILRETGRKMSYSSVRRRLIDYGLYEPWRSEGK